jgi:hypothetical protein
MALTSKLKIQ